MYSRFYSQQLRQVAPEAATLPSQLYGIQNPELEDCALSIGKQARVAAEVALAGQETLFRMSSSRAQREFLYISIPDRLETGLFDRSIVPRGDLEGRPSTFEIPLCARYSSSRATRSLIPTAS